MPTCMFSVAMYPAPSPSGSIGRLLPLLIPSFSAVESLPLAATGGSHNEGLLGSAYCLMVALPMMQLGSSAHDNLYRCKEGTKPKVIVADHPTGTVLRPTLLKPNQVPILLNLHAREYFRHMQSKNESDCKGVSAMQR